MGILFYDLDDEVKKHYDTTLEEFVKKGILNKRDKKRGLVLNKIMDNFLDKVVAISPIYYASNFNEHVSKVDVIAIELQDSPENIFQRLVFSDKNDESYIDDDYKEKHRKYFISEIKKDQTCYKTSFSTVNNEFQINNDSVDMVIERIIKEYNLMDI